MGHTDIQQGLTASFYFYTYALSFLVYAHKHPFHNLCKESKYKSGLDYNMDCTDAENGDTLSLHVSLIIMIFMIESLCKHLKINTEEQHQDSNV